ncbi:phosphatidylinositol 3,4,5-trisphosphate 3-phosphatase and dual-specificity protein phosphatase PTEN-like isoform X2 [Amphiura filiformis]|uniref:phosphatidylinositol 3,4,5-trisphosphate 3-phosphatase and dual-specificity protein phosphatase PTEN-like isoform X2 n=1 Tax=Amphiura filiformis TaxID=82378 RepID=UPI003B222F2F
MSSGKTAGAKPNKNMASRLRGMVSKKKRRFTDGTFDLDLSYIYPNIIAMGFPAEKLEGVYRNNVETVVRFLTERHGEHYKVYNLCAERNYDPSRFNNRVAQYAFEDHNPPKIELIRPFCEDLDEWLGQDEKNIAAIHCKAGKGRTGVMICAYMLHQRRYETARAAMEYYASARTTNGKGVTIPSQKRYIEYYGYLVYQELEYKPTTLLLEKVLLETIPMISNGVCTPYFIVFQQKVKIFTSPTTSEGVKRGDKHMEIILNQSVPICGDIKLEFFHRSNKIKKEKMFHFWFNTFFVTDSTTSSHPMSNGSPSNNSAYQGSNKSLLSLTLKKEEIDRANKDKTNKFYSPNFKITCFFSQVESERTRRPSTDGSQSSGTGSDERGDLSDQEDLSDSDSESEWDPADITRV